MSTKEFYKGRCIMSDPFELQDGGFSSNGIIETHKHDRVTDFKPNDLQSKEFTTEEEADSFYIEEAKKIIDKYS
jgi:hypothetical protein